MAMTKGAKVLLGTAGAVAACWLLRRWGALGSPFGDYVGAGLTLDLGKRVVLGPSYPVYPRETVWPDADGCYRQLRWIRVGGRWTKQYVYFCPVGSRGWRKIKGEEELEAAEQYRRMLRYLIDRELGKYRLPGSLTYADRHLAALSNEQWSDMVRGARSRGIQVKPGYYPKASYATERDLEKELRRRGYYPSPWVRGWVTGR